MEKKKRDSVVGKELELIGASIEDVAEMNGGSITNSPVEENMVQTIGEHNLDTRIFIRFYVGVLELGVARRMFELGLGFAGSWNVMIGGQAKYWELQMAHQLFFEMPERNVTSWNSMIAAFSQSGRLNCAISLYEWVHEHTIASGIAMTTAYARHGRIHEAMIFFERIPKPKAMWSHGMPCLQGMPKKKHVRYSGGCTCPRRSM
ncbi:hypothetical protein CKAN_01404300 [Cinnamomum micranthum f. kanehirae]|uniref:Pentatricopeptide repeat-containing protein n=1 Tax=Cinnamomum micranthum f. kanehirae TaxID=337451 RepID=A0A443P2Z3_9MAGN|nr:hypothetical protein CKAN_01404300 [Cinnamomum micranthum f. kanehirae]